VPVRISFPMPLVGRRSAEQVLPSTEQAFLPVRPAGFQPAAIDGETGRMPVWRTDLEVCVPSEADGLFQFKFPAVERHHFGNAADFDLANICAIT
jgi:hypothetical protein